MVVRSIGKANGLVVTEIWRLVEAGVCWVSEVARCVGASWRYGGHRRGPRSRPQEDPNPSHSLSLGMLVGCPHPKRTTSVRVGRETFRWWKRRDKVKWC